MKVSKGRTKFEPIVITVETEDEAEFLWRLLRMPDCVVEEHYPDYAVTADSLQMFGAFDSVFKPANEDC